MNGILVKSIEKFYGNRRVLTDLSFKVDFGTIHGLLGPNGAGKSTIMKIISGILMPSTGDVFVSNLSVTEKTLDAKKLIGFLPENPPLYHDMVVLDYLKYVASLYGIAGAELLQNVSYAISKTNIKDVEHRLIRNLSKGYKQRVGIAMALVHRPAFLIFDEPTVGLDPASILEIRELILGLKNDHTVLLSSHILHEVEKVCTHLTIIDKGLIKANGSTESISKQIDARKIYTAQIRNFSEEKCSNIKANIREIDTISNFTEDEKKFIRIVLKEHSSDKVGEQLVSQIVASDMGLLAFKEDRFELEKLFFDVTREK